MPETLLLRLPQSWLLSGVRDRLLELLPGWEIVHEEPDDGSAPSDRPVSPLLERATVVIGMLSTDELEQAQRLRWVQLWGAGVDALLSEETAVNRAVTITSVSGIHETPMAEHAFALLLALTRGIHHAVRAEASRQWAEGRARGIVELRDKRLLVVGMGHIGAEIARIGQALRMQVTGVRRQARDTAVEVGGAEPVPVVGIAELTEALSTADVVVVVAPLTAQTRGLFDRHSFSAMKRGSLFLNLGRGRIVDEPALIESLQSGHIAAAGLDVFAREPLPDDSPLWNMENVIITAHYGGVSPRYNERAWEVALDNVARFAAGTALRNVVDPNIGY